jgi:hypothetical protein
MSHQDSKYCRRGADPLSTMNRITYFAVVSDSSHRRHRAVLSATHFQHEREILGLHEEGVVLLVLGTPDLRR